MVTEGQLRKFRRDAEEKKERSKELTEKFGKKDNVKIDILDLNPSFTRGTRIPKSKLTSTHQRIFDIGHANTRRREISVDERVPKRLQKRVIQHELEHIKNPRATESQVQKITKEKFGFKNINDKIKSKKKKRRKDNFFDLSLPDLSI